MTSKTQSGNFFEDFRVGQHIAHATPRNVTDAEVALSFNGLANVQTIAAIHGGRHANPTFAGDTIYAWTEVLERQTLPARSDLGALRLRTVATKDRPGADFPYQDASGAYEPGVVLDFDYTVLMPRRG